MQKATADRKANRNYETVNNEAELDNLFKKI